MAQNDSESFTPRHYIAFTALISGCVALYLHLWKLGLMGVLSCNAAQTCERVMTSPWSYFPNVRHFLGWDVALIGTVGYSLILITALVGIQPKFSNDRRITKVLAFLIIIAFLFTLRLKYYEWFVMKTFCKWCAISAVTITTHVVAAGMDWKRVEGR